MKKFLLIAVVIVLFFLLTVVIVSGTPYLATTKTLADKTLVNRTLVDEELAFENVFLAPIPVYINGRLIVTYGTSAYVTFGIESFDEGNTWSDPWEIPRVWSNFPMLVYGNRLIGFKLDLRTVSVECYPLLSYSDDYGRTWTDVQGLPIKFGSEGGVYCGSFQGCVTEDGTYIMGGWFCTTAPRVSSDFRVFTWVCDKGKSPSVASSWVLSNDVIGEEPTIVERSPLGEGHLSMFARGHNGWTEYYESDDYARSWHTVLDSPKIQNPDAPLSTLRVSSEKVMLCFDNSQKTRNPLMIASSLDNCKSFKSQAEITSGGLMNCYPSMTLLGQGEICIGWLHIQDDFAEGRLVILRANPLALMRWLFG